MPKFYQAYALIEQRPERPNEVWVVEGCPAGFDTLPGFGIPLRDINPSRYSSSVRCIACTKRSSGTWVVEVKSALDRVFGLDS